MNTNRYFVLASMLALTTVISACNSTSTGPAPTPPGPILPAAPVLPSAAPFTSATIDTTVPSTAAAVALPAAGGYSGSIDFGVPTSLPPGTTISSQVSNVAPGGDVPTLSSNLRQALAERNISSAIGGISVLVYDQFVFSNVVSYAKAPSFVITVPPADIVNASYYIACYDPTRPSLGWQLGFEGPGTITGSTISLSSVSFSPFTFAANAYYYFALFAISTSASVPTPAPSIAPIAPATVAPTAAPSPSPGSTATPVPGGSSQPATPVPGGSSQPATPVPGGSSQPAAGTP